MRYSEKGPSGEETREDIGGPERKVGDSLYFFPDAEVSESRARALLANGSPEERAWAVSHLLRYAQWDDIWTYVTREEVRQIFPDLELPENLQSAWARMLKIEAPVA